MSPQEFFVWLSSSAGAMAAFSFIVERIPAWHNLPSASRSYLTLAGTLVLSLGGYAVLTYVPPEVLEAIKPWFALVAGILATWITGQLAHAADPERIRRGD